MSNELSYATMIYTIRNQRVMIDSDLAKLYGVEARVLNQAVKRNISRFPEDFMFQLNIQEFENLKSQIVISKSDSHGGRRYLPYAFTEQGVAMLSSVLHSEQAINVNIAIMRTFTKIRQTIENRSKENTLEDLRQMLLMHIDHDEDRFNKQQASINQIIRVINYMQQTPEKEYKIGFNVKK